MAKINSIEFNQDFSCVSVATTEHNRIFNCDPFGEFYSSSTSKGQPRRTISKSTDNSDSATVESGEAQDVIGQPTKFLRMLFSTPLTIIVPLNSDSSKDRLLHIYNLKLLLKICELTFPTAISDVKVNRRRLVVLLESGQIYIYDLSCVRLLKVMDISPQKRYVFDLSVDENSMLVIPLSVVAGSDLALLQREGVDSFDNIVDFSKQKPSKSTKPELETVLKDPEGWLLVYDCVGLKPVLIYRAHDSNIASLAVSHDGSMIASASVKGTIIRVSSLNYDKAAERITINKVANLRRGHNPTSVNSLSFSLDNSILGCGSVNYTVHLFKLDESTSETESRDEKDDQGDETMPLNDPEEDSDQNDGDRLSDAETNSNRSTEDLNESLANLLISRSNEDDNKDGLAMSYGEGSGTLPSGPPKHKSYFKLLNNHYARLLIKKLPYKNYLDNLIWTPPRRSFAFIKVPENSAHGQLKIGFSQDLVLLAAYNSGKLLKYRLPYNFDSDRQECQLVSSYDLV